MCWRSRLACSIVFLVMIGTIWIMAHMNANMGVSPEVTNLQMQH